jgi:NAD(P)-dependent dehydrogenase (short-subunit alcohol dehydrogenase family)
MSRSPEKVDAAVGRQRIVGAEAAGSAADIRDPDATTTALRWAHEEFGDIDVLISGAAGNFPASALEMSPNAFRSVVDIDLLGTYHVLRAASQVTEAPAPPGAILLARRRR